MQFDQSKLTTKEVNSIFGEIGDELESTLQEFPLFPCDPLHAIGVVNEEIGEVAKDVLQWTYEPKKMKNGATTRKELIQTAAMCIRMISGIDSGDIKP
jgi:hypothetical protein